MHRRWMQRKEARQAARAPSSGEPLPDATRDKFERSTGADLSGVRLHTGEDSAAEARDLSARAFTVGQDIHVGQGELSGAGGETLLAHEVAHTVQQSKASVGTAQLKSAVSQPDEPLELEADAAAEAMVSGRSAEISSGGGQIMRSAMPHAEQERQGVASPTDGHGEAHAPEASQPAPFGNDARAAIHSLSTEILIASLQSLASSAIAEAHQVRVVVAVELGSRLGGMEQLDLFMLQSALASDSTAEGSLLHGAVTSELNGRMETGEGPAVGRDDGNGRAPSESEAAGEDPQLTALKNMESGGPITLFNNLRLVLRGGSQVELINDINEEHELTAGIDDVLAEGAGPEAVERREAQDEVGEFDTSHGESPTAQHGNDTHERGTTGEGTSAPRQQRRAAERARRR